MTDEKNKTDTSIIKTDVSEGLVDIIGDTLTNIPAPIRKNALKAFGQLCTAAIDIPVAFLEGVSAEKRAETQARIKIIDTGATQITQQMNVDPEYAHAAVKKYGQKIIREQVNLDHIAEIAATELNKKTEETETKTETDTQVEDINSDWLNSFEKEAREKSTDEMKLLFGKVLAGEIHKPSTFSIKTIKVMSQIDKNVATLFQHLCSLSSTMYAQTLIIDSRVISLGGDAGQNKLQEYGINFANLNTLQEYGLINSEYNSQMDFKSCIPIKLHANQVPLEGDYVQTPFKHQGKLFCLRQLDISKAASDKLKINGVGLSKSGKELLGVIDILKAESYTNKLIEFFKNEGFEMTEIAP